MAKEKLRYTYQDGRRDDVIPLQPFHCRHASPPHPEAYIYHLHCVLARTGFSVSPS